MSQALNYPPYPLQSPLTTPTQCFWYVGDTPRFFQSIRDFYPGHYLKSHHCTWYDYNFEETVIIEDLGYPSVFLGPHIQQWTGSYPFSTHVRGQKYYLKPSVFVITSRYTPEELWQDHDDFIYEVISERFTVIHNIERD